MKPAPPNAGRTRLAPTPSGLLHGGNALNFLLTEHLARRTGALLRLRIDDLDAERVRPELLQDIFDGLLWLGIRPDVGPAGPADHELHWSQRSRIPRYMELLQALREAGAVHACRCSRQQRAAISRPTCPCRNAGFDLDDPAMAWRLRVPVDATVEVRPWRGPVRVAQPFELLPDPVVLQREQDGRPRRPAYQVASLADDVDHATTFIVRGQDLWPSTVLQLHMAAVLGFTTFSQVRFVHHPLLTDRSGNKLSKSDGAHALRAMRSAGMGPDLLVTQALAWLEELCGPA